MLIKSTFSCVRRPAFVKMFFTLNKTFVLPTRYNIQRLLQLLNFKYTINESNNNIKTHCINCSNKEALLLLNDGFYYCHVCKTTQDWDKFKTALINNNLKKTKELIDKSLKNNDLIDPLISRQIGHLEKKDLDEATYNKFLNNNSQNTVKMQTLIDYKVINLNDRICYPKFAGDMKSIVQLTIVKDNSITCTPDKISIPCFFGYNLINDETREIIITDNQLSAMCLYQTTGIPTLSMPYKNYILPSEFVLLLSRFDKVTMWFENNNVAKNAYTNIAKLIGIDVCYKIQHDLIPLDLSNESIYELFKIGYDLKHLVDSASKTTTSDLVKFKNLEDVIRLELMHSKEEIGLPFGQFPRLTNILGGMRPGELTIFSGTTGSGKTTFLSQLSLDICHSHNIPILWGSFEISTTRMMKRMMYQYFKKKIDETPSEFDQYSAKFKKVFMIYIKLPINFMNYFGSTKIKDVMSSLEHAANIYGVRLVVIDNLQFMTSGLGARFEKWEIQDHVVDQLRKFSTNNNVHIILVAHPKKEAGKFLDINSIFGSAKLTQDADNVVVLQRTDHNELRFIEVKKNRFSGRIGAIPVNFDPDIYSVY